MTDNNKIGTNCRRYNTHQGGTIDTTKNRLVGSIKDSFFLDKAHPITFFF